MENTIQRFEINKSFWESKLKEPENKRLDIDLEHDLLMLSDAKGPKTVTHEQFQYTVVFANKKDVEFEEEDSREHVRVNSKPSIDDIIEQDAQDYQALLNDSDKKFVRLEYQGKSVTRKERLKKKFKSFGKRKVKSVVPIKYLHTKADDMNVPKKDGFCLPEGLVRLYKKYIPTLTIDKVNELLFEYHRKNCGTELCNKEHIVDHLKGFSEKYRISRVGLDIKNSIQDRIVFKSSKYPALVYYVCDEHIYFVNDKKTRSSLSRINDSVKSISSITSQEVENEALTDYEIIEIPEMFDIDEVCKTVKAKGDKKTLLVNINNLKSIMKKIFSEKSICCKCRVSKGSVCKLETDSHVILSNPNHRLQISFEETIKLCKSFNIPFRNQSITSIAWDIYKDTNNTTTGESRIRLSQKLKQTVYDRQEGKCNMCLMVKNTFEYDHIVPLSQKGTNDIENIQGLCKECHAKKSEKEAMDKYFECDFIKSFFNSSTKEIFTVKKNAHIWGSQCAEADKWDEHVIREGLDANKSRRNQLAFSKYNFPVYTSLDEPELFDRKDKLVCGYYFIVSNNKMPLKGNGWYSLPMVKYCLKKKIIRRGDITHKLLPSYTISKDYFVPFYNYIMKKNQKGNEQAFKALFNCFVGSFGTKEVKVERLTLVKSIEEASYLCVKYNQVPYQDRDNKLYEVKDTTTFLKNDSYVPIFNQILDMETIELYRMSEIILKFNGVPTFYNTDQVVGNFKEQKDIDDMKDYIKSIYWDEEKTVLKYKLDDKVLGKCDIEPTICNESYFLKENKWIDVKDTGFKGEEATNDFAKMIIDKYARLNLTCCRRADDTLFNLCKTLDVECFDFKEAVCMFNIVKTNSLRKKLNTLCIEKRISKNKIKRTVELKESQKNKQSQDFKLFKGIPLMGSITNREYNLINSGEYVCKGFDDKVAIIGDVHGTEVRDIPLEEVTRFLVPMYAVTVHKSQGITLDKPYTIWQWNKMDNRSKYVCLSRSGDIRNININTQCTE